VHIISTHMCRCFVGDCLSARSGMIYRRIANYHNDIPRLSPMPRVCLNDLNTMMILFFNRKKRSHCFNVR